MDQCSYNVFCKQWCVSWIRFESDMLLQRYKATADFIEYLQDHVDSDMKIQEYLTRKKHHIMHNIWIQFFIQID